MAERGKKGTTNAVGGGEWFDSARRLSEVAVLQCGVELDGNGRQEAAF